VKSLQIDCDGDAVLLRVEQRGGAACHTGKRSCFFRRLENGEWIDVGVQVFDPDEVYGR
jgi:phosphoribosyl-AMP cyclohydrolase